MGQTTSKYLEDYKSKKATDLSLTYQRLDHIHPSLFLPHATKWDFSFNNILYIQPEITLLESLTFLDVSYNELDCFPLPLCDVASLRYLNMSCNLIASLPPQIEKLNNLCELFLSYNRLERLPENIGELRSLTTLSITNNFITDIPASLSSLSNLKSLNLKSNNIALLPEGLFSLSELRILVLSNNNISEVSAALGLLKNLTRLSISQNCFSSFPPEDLDAELSSLSEIKMNGNKYLKRLNKSFSMVNRLVNLNLKNCPNLKVFPSQLFHYLTNLEGLDICHNPQLTFTDDQRLPADWKLRKIIISNDMTTIPFLETNKHLVSCKNKGKVDEELLREHVSHLVNLGVWSGGYDFPSVEEEIKKTLMAMTPIRKGLFLSSRYGAQNRTELMANNISHILMVGSELTPFFPDEFEYFSIQVKDLSACDLSVYFGACHKFIEIGRKKGGVLVHCAAGVSRSPSVVMSYLMWSENMTFATARKEVTKLRPIVKTNFYNQLERYSKYLKTKDKATTKLHQRWVLQKERTLAKFELKL